MSPEQLKDVGVVVIGRNEGERLRRCLQSLPSKVNGVYVDSGSSDGSQDLAASSGLDVVDLKIPPNFTAARARNAGIARLLQRNPGLRFVQVIDGDCELDPGWMQSARAALLADSRFAVVFGRRRERFPNASVYNRMCDDEWDVPVGEAQSCGGDALFRISPLVAVGGYTEAMIAGEEPDLCLRMRAQGWRVQRIAAEMTRHDAAIVRYGQWWRRARRGGHAFAELVCRHGSCSDPHWIREIVSMSAWSVIALGGVFAVSAGTLLGHPAVLTGGWTLIALFSLQVSRLAWRKSRSGTPLGLAASWALLLMTGKLAQTQGAIEYCLRRLLRRSGTIIEYKT